MNKFTTNDARIVESKANDPTQADRDLFEELLKCVHVYNVTETHKSVETTWSVDRNRAAKLISQHVQEEVQQAVRAETQRMCDVAYAVYNHGDPEVPTLWMDGAAAVLEALGEEVK